MAGRAAPAVPAPPGCSGPCDPERRVLGPDQLWPTCGLKMPSAWQTASSPRCQQHASGATARGNSWIQDRSLPSPCMTSPPSSPTSWHPKELAHPPPCPPPTRFNGHMSAAGIKAQTVAINSFGSGVEDTSPLTWPDRGLCDPLAEHSLRGSKSGPQDTWVPIPAPP